MWRRRGPALDSWWLLFIPGAVIIPVLAAVATSALVVVVSSNRGTEELFLGKGSSVPQRPPSPLSQPPRIQIASNTLIGDGSVLSIDGIVEDPDSSVWTAKVDYGDASRLEPVSINADRSFSLNHDYKEAGAYDVILTITDGEGAQTSVTISVDIETTQEPKVPSTAGTFSLMVQHPQDKSLEGTIIRFQIDRFYANEAAVWRHGGADQLDLTTAADQLALAPPRSILSASLAQFPDSESPRPPHVFVGTALLDGLPVANGTVIRAWTENLKELVGTGVVGEFPTWLVPQRPPAELEEIPAGIFVRVWRFDNRVNQWFEFDFASGFDAFKRLSYLSSGDLVWIHVRNNQMFQTQPLYPGWNLIAIK